MQGISKVLVKDTAIINGWIIKFRRNIHMHYHSLSTSKNGLEVKIPCEDTPDGYLGIWPYDIEIPK